MMNIKQTPLFGRQYKKIHKNRIAHVNDAIRQIQSNPVMGEMKKGDLAGVRVHKFEVNDELWLLAYEVEEDHLLLLALASHENFYRQLKKYLKK